MSTRSRAQQPSPSMQAEEALGAQEMEQDTKGLVTRNFTTTDVAGRLGVGPVTALRFSRENSTAFELVTFTEIQSFVRWLANTIGVIRLVSGQVSELVDVPTPVLLTIYNSTRADTPLDRFRDRKTAEARTAEVLMGLAVKWEDSEMAKAEAATGQTATEAKALEKKAAREAKAVAKTAEKEAKAKAAAEKRAGGVIGTIRKRLESKSGATQSEILDDLVTKFPDRTRDGMSSTVKIQCSRLAKTLNREIATKEVVERGRVYKFVDAGPIPGKEVVKEAPKVEPAQPKAAKTGGKKTATPAAAGA